MTDPHINLRAGVSTRDQANFDDPTTGIWTDRNYEWCAQHGEMGYACSRPRDHDESWRHIACDGSVVLSIWGGTVVVDPGQYPDDPFADISINPEDNVGSFPAWDEPTTGLRVAHTLEGAAQRSAWCQKDRNGADSTPDHRVAQCCTRPAGHPPTWKCVSTTSSGRVLWVAGPFATQPKQPKTVESMFPEDGAEQDSDELLAPSSVTEGMMLRVRNRKTRLYAIGTRSGDEVEALNLDDNVKLVVVPREWLVEFEGYPSVAEFQQITQWYADLRTNVRRVAVREYRNDRWCMDGLNENLATMGMAKYEPILFGELHLIVPIECEDIHRTSSQLASAVLKELPKDKIQELLSSAMPTEFNGVRLDTEGLRVVTENIRRK